ncbi:MAG TPA: PD-(D/E)XK nuclease family protein [Acidimicrobiales bacterium]|nr:PD-(D/E)XK nuclease family protein [Acidimicrobiales bacterium]
MSLTLPISLSPTRVTSFTDCPLAFRLRAIDRLPEPPSPHTTKGTLVHQVLERLVWDHDAGERTAAVARAELDRAWGELQDSEEYAALELDGTASTAFLADAVQLVENYFALEDPTTVEAVGIEVRLEADLDGLKLRGIIDRLDLNATGELVVVDYKTGRAPSERFEKSKMTGVHLYALLCEQTLGRVPVEVRLLHLREPLSISATPSPQTLRGQRVRTVAVWKAIERACERDDFQPRPSPLCDYCSYHEWCPAFGGVPPALPTA